MTAHVQSAAPTDHAEVSPALMQLGIMKFTAIFGQIVSLFLRSAKHRHQFIADLEWSVLPALVNNQYLVSETVDKTSGIRSPVAVIMWAMVSNDVDKRLSSDLSLRPVLKPEEWKSGPIPWLVEAVGDQHAVSALVKALVDKKFKETGLRLVRIGEDHVPIAGVLRAAPESAANAQEPLAPVE
jgi:hemolysin-activating ACP:hemolysin acyltransferase